MREMKRLSSYMHACEWFSALWRSRFTRHSSPANRRKFYLVVFFYYSIASSRARVPWFLWQHRAISRIYANTVQMRVSMAATRPTIGNLHENYATFAVFVGYWDLMCDKHCCWLALRAQPTIAPRQNWVCPIVIVIYLFCCFFVVIVVLSTKLSTDNDQTEFPFQVTSTQWNISKTHTEKTKKKNEERNKILVKMVTAGLQPLEFTDCLLDSPEFRENLNKHEKELEKTSQQIKRIIKEVKDLLAAAKSEYTHTLSMEYLIQEETDWVLVVIFYSFGLSLFCCADASMGYFVRVLVEQKLRMLRMRCALGLYYVSFCRR